MYVMQLSGQNMSLVKCQKRNNELHGLLVLEKMFRDSLIMSVKLLSNATSKIPQFVITIFIIVWMQQQYVSLRMH